MTQNRFKVGVELKFWVAVTFHRDERLVKCGRLARPSVALHSTRHFSDFCCAFVEAARNLGMNVYPRSGQAQYVNPASSPEAIAATMAAAKASVEPNQLQFALVILDRENSPLKGPLSLIGPRPG